MLCHGSACGRLPGVRRGRRSGRERTWGAAPSFGSCSSPAPARYGRPFTARICVRARAGVGAGAVRAPDCPRVRQAQGALRLSAESGSFRTGPARAGRGSGCRFPRTIIAHFLKNASPIEKYYSNIMNNFVPASAGCRIPRPGVGTGLPDSHILFRLVCGAPAVLAARAFAPFACPRESGDPSLTRDAAAAGGEQAGLPGLSREPRLDPGSGAGATESGHAV